MKTYLGILICAVAMVGCQNEGNKISFEDASGQFSLLNSYDPDLGDLSPEDLEAIADQENNPGEDTEVIQPIDDGDDVVDDVIPPGEDNIPVTCPDSNNLVATSNECLRYIENVQSLLALDDGSTIKNFKGNLKVRAGNIVSIRNTKGNLVLVGIGSASIDHIKDVTGNLLICNMNVGVIERTSKGNILLDGGNVCLVNGHVGNLRVNNGSIGEVRNGVGNVNVVNGDIQYVRNQRGNVTVHSGSVGDIERHTGNAVVYDGSLNSTYNTRGNIRVENGNLGYVDTHKGNVNVKGGSITGTVTNVTGNVRVH